MHDIQFVMLGRFDVIESFLEKFTQRGGKYGCVEIDDWNHREINLFFKSKTEYDALISLLNDTIANGGNTIEGISVRPGLTSDERKSQAYVKNIGIIGDKKFQTMNAGLGREKQRKVKAVRQWACISQM